MEELKLFRDGLLARLGSIARHKFAPLRLIRMRRLQKRIDALERVLKG